MLDLDHIEQLILRPPSSAFDREMLLELVRECRELRARVVELMVPPPPPPPPPVELRHIPPGQVVAQPEPPPTPPEKPKAKGRGK